MIGARALSAMSWILVILRACASDSEPPNTVKSLEKTNTVRPLIVPQPGDHAVARDLVLGHAEIRASGAARTCRLLERAVVEQEVDALPGRELAALCCASILAEPPPSRARARRSSSRSRMSFMSLRPLAA
jgi:hypothetical protein